MGKFRRNYSPVSYPKPIYQLLNRRISRPNSLFTISTISRSVNYFVASKCRCTEGAPALVPALYTLGIVVLHFRIYNVYILVKTQCCQRPEAIRKA